MTGIELIAQERQNQIKINIKPLENEWNLSLGVMFMACPENIRNRITLFDVVPDNVRKEAKEMTRIRQLQIAGALIAAEIDRLQALEGKENG